jgi:hypothetical protein
VAEEDMAGHFAYLKDTIEGVPAHFVYNMDELGHQPWADAKVATCIVPAEYTEKTVYYHVFRQGKWITLIACVEATFMALYREQSIIPVFIPLHSSHMLQVLDVSIFGVTKRTIAGLNRFRKSYVQMETVSDVMETFFKSASPRNIVMSFQMAGASVVRDHHSNVFVRITPDTAVLAQRHPQEAHVSEQTEACDATRSEEVRKTEIEHPGTM